MPGESTDKHCKQLVKVKQMHFPKKISNFSDDQQLGPLRWNVFDLFDKLAALEIENKNNLYHRIIMFSDDD